MTLLTNPQDAMTTDSEGTPTPATLPQSPGPTATDEEKTAYSYAYHAFKAESERMQAKAHSELAAAFSKAADVQAAMSKQDLILFFAGKTPQRATDTPNSYFDALATMVDQFLKEHGAP